MCAGPEAGKGLITIDQNVRILCVKTTSEGLPLFRRKDEPSGIRGGRDGVRAAASDRWCPVPGIRRANHRMGGKHGADAPADPTDGDDGN